GDRKVSTMPARPGIGKLEVKWDRVVNACPDAGVGQVALQISAGPCSNDVEVVDRLRPGWHVGDGDGGGAVGQQLVVHTRALATLLVPLGEVPKLRAQDPRLYGVEPAVVPLHGVEVFLRLPVVAQLAAVLGQALVVRGDRPRLATRAEILAGVEAEDRRVAHRAGLAPSAVLPREV